MKTYFFLIKDGVAVGYLDYEPSEDALEVYDDVVRLETDQLPDLYIGLTPEQFQEDPLPEPEAKHDYENTQTYRRHKLKELYSELKFTTEILEDTTDLQAEYDALLLEYNNRKLA